METEDEGFDDDETFEDQEYEDEDDADNRGVALVLFGAAVGALVVGALWFGQTALTGEDSTDQGALSSQSRQDPGTRPQGGTRGVGAAQDADEGRASEGTSDSDSTKAACEEIFTLQAQPLRTGARALGQWEVHIGAMNQLVAGTISLPAARRYWEQTRQGAKQRLAAFESAMREWEGRDVRCPRPDQLPRRLRQDECVESVWKRSVALRAATTSLHLWREHIRHMEMLRDGTMSPAEATRLWLESWRKGDRALQTYARASRKAAPLGC